ncbi:MAG: metallophosphoesterase [Lachnospiraceae bacterium]|nr:metallophosphoesterase [Lachnospiraceae bacterium]
MKNIKTKKIVMVLLILVISLFSWVYWGNVSIQTTQTNIESKNLPKALDSFKIAQVSDLHNACFGTNQSKLLSAIKEANPDMIAVTGDLIDSRHTNIQKAMDFINGAVNIAPVYYVTGNHEARIKEYAKLEEQMYKAGVTILRDKSLLIEYNGSFIQILGLDDPSFSSGNSALEKSNAEIDIKLKNMLTPNFYKVLLSHRPELLDIYAQNNIDLVLSGHAHGGQIRLPFIGGFFAPNQGFFPKYSKGVYEKDQTKMVVSRGLGNSIFPVRINNRPELVVITLNNK